MRMGKASSKRSPNIIMERVKTAQFDSVFDKVGA